MIKLNHFVCECGAEIFFNDTDKFVVKEWTKYHKPHMKKYLKGTLKEALEMLIREAGDEASDE